MGKKSLKQILMYNSPDGTLGGAAFKMGLSRQTLSKAVCGVRLSRHTAKKISDFTDGEYSVAELMGVDNA